MDAEVLKEFVENQRRKKPSIGQLEHMFELIKKGALTGAKLQRFMESLGQFEASYMTYIMTSRAGCAQPSYEELQARFYAVHPDYERAHFFVTGPEAKPGQIRVKYAFIERNICSAEEAIEEMRKNGFRPAVYEELLDFVPDSSDPLQQMIKAHRFIALGSYWKDEYNERCFPVLQKMFNGPDRWSLTLAKLSDYENAGPLPEDMAFLIVEM